eukprot:TRINITY_DN9210_c0_g1_i2.p3 TRINITY_DN9210_c0_g1~~TRINITY_DN9210_c0_g1_i2.p3  ORF type:complete len:289 (+),score=63.22 TRINITY_DN9210_c0_g1_i2:1222-2088(+)
MYIVVDPVEQTVTGLSANLEEVFPAGTIGQMCASLVEELPESDMQISEVDARQPWDALTQCARAAAAGDLTFVYDVQRVRLRNLGGSFSADIVGAQAVSDRAVAVRLLPVGMRRLSERAIRFQRSGVSDELACVVDAVAEPCAVISQGGRVNYINESFGAIFECDPTSAVGKNVNSFIPPCYREKHVIAMHRMANSTRAQRRTMRRPVLVVGAALNSDKLIPLTMTVGELPGANQGDYMVVARVVQPPSNALRNCTDSTAKVVLAGGKRPRDWQTWQSALELLTTAER